MVRKANKGRANLPISASTPPRNNHNNETPIARDYRMRLISESVDNRAFCRRKSTVFVDFLIGDILKDKQTYGAIWSRNFMGISLIGTLNGHERLGNGGCRFFISLIYWYCSIGMEEGSSIKPIEIKECL